MYRKLVPLAARGPPATWSAAYRPALLHLGLEHSEPLRGCHKIMPTIDHIGAAAVLQLRKSCETAMWYLKFIALIVMSTVGCRSQGLLPC